MKALLLACILVVSGLQTVDASTPDEKILFGIAPGDRLTITTRSNVRIHLNGSYKGFRYGEERIILDETPAPDSDGTAYTGQAFILSQTVRDQRQTARAVDTVLPIELHIDFDGAYRMEQGTAAVAVRSIPRFPLEQLSPGDTWESYGEVVVDPFQDGAPTRVPVLIAYRYDGLHSYLGEPAALITARYALRYRSGQDPQGDPELDSIQGRHDLQIFMDTDGTRPLFIRDTLEDQFRYRDDTSVSMSGFRLTFFKAPNPRNPGYMRERFQRDIPRITSLDRNDRSQQPDSTDDAVPDEAAADEASPDSRVKQSIPDSSSAEDAITLEETDLGLRLSLPSLQFVADEAVLLPGERARLNSLAEALDTALEVNPDSSFLVAGHTADIGRPQAQQQLSTDRAKAIVDALTERGLPADRFLYQGRGGSEPVADNATAEGRALNRRVEVYILE